MTEDQFNEMFYGDDDVRYLDDPGMARSCLGLFFIVGLAWLVVVLAWAVLT